MSSFFNCMSITNSNVAGYYPYPPEGLPGRADQFLLIDDDLRAREPSFSHHTHAFDAHNPVARDNFFPKRAWRPVPLKLFGWVPQIVLERMYSIYPDGTKKTTSDLLTKFLTSWMKQSGTIVQDSMNATLDSSQPHPEHVRTTPDAAGSGDAMTLHQLEQLWRATSLHTHPDEEKASELEESIGKTGSSLANQPAIRLQSVDGPTGLDVPEHGSRGANRGQHDDNLSGSTPAQKFNLVDYLKSFMSTSETSALNDLIPEESEGQSFDFSGVQDAVDSKYDNDEDPTVDAAIDIINSQTTLDPDNEYTARKVGNPRLEVQGPDLARRDGAGGGGGKAPKFGDAQREQKKEIRKARPTGSIDPREADLHPTVGGNAVNTENARRLFIGATIAEIITRYTGSRAVGSLVAFQSTDAVLAIHDRVMSNLDELLRNAGRFNDEGMTTIQMIRFYFSVMATLHILEIQFHARVMASERNNFYLLVGEFTEFFSTLLVGFASIVLLSGVEKLTGFVLLKEAFVNFSQGVVGRYEDNFLSWLYHNGTYAETTYQRALRVMTNYNFRSMEDMARALKYMTLARAMTVLLPRFPWDKIVNVPVQVGRRLYGSMSGSVPTNVSGDAIRQSLPNSLEARAILSSHESAPIAANAGRNRAVQMYTSMDLLWESVYNVGIEFGSGNVPFSEFRTIGERVLNDMPPTMKVPGDGHTLVGLTNGGMMYLVKQTIDRYERGLERRRDIPVNREGDTPEIFLTDSHSVVSYMAASHPEFNQYDRGDLDALFLSYWALEKKQFRAPGYSNAVPYAFTRNGFLRLTAKFFEFASKRAGKAANSLISQASSGLNPQPEEKKDDDRRLPEAEIVEQHDYVSANSARDVCIKLFAPLRRMQGFRELVNAFNAWWHDTGRSKYHSNVPGHETKYLVVHMSQFPLLATEFMEYAMGTISKPELFDYIR